jgi:DNA polymerase-3 subunit epsilon
MNARLRLAISVIILFLLVTGPFLITAALVWADAQADERAALLRLIAHTCHWVR